MKGLLLLTALAVCTARGDTTFHRDGPLLPGPDDGRIAVATARLLEQDHYLQMPFNDVVSSNFFTQYFETFDPQHFVFLQSDIEEFKHLELTLDDLTQKRNVGPGFDIFERFFQRFSEQSAYATELLQTEDFVFEDTETILLNRRDAPYPADLDEAKSLWRDRLRFEYLTEKLALVAERKESAESKAAAEDSETALEDSPPPQTVDEEIKGILTRRYARSLKFFGEWDSDDVIQYYLSTLARVYDPHSDYMGRAQLEQFAITMNLALFGIGAQLMSEDGYCTIQRLLPGGPAIKSKKLKDKDRIVAVAQADGEPVDVVDMNIRKIVQLIRGPKGSEVRLTIMPPKGEASAERSVVKLIRDEIPLEDQAAKAKLIEVSAVDGRTNRLGVIDLPSFYASMRISRANASAKARSTTRDVSQLIGKLKEENIDGLILDLRRNGGGSLEEAVNLTGLFIKEGPVVQVRNVNGSVNVDEDNDPSVLYDGPMVVLTSRGSASASEILAGALQDYGRALIVGDASTHGKGTVQSLNRLDPFLRLARQAEDPGAVKITIRKFYRVNGDSTQLLGITPDIVLPSVANVLENVGEASLDNPLKWDNDLDSADFDSLDRVNRYVPELTKNSEARIALSQDYDYIREDMERIQKRQLEKTILLNEAERTTELEENKARVKAREEERAARPANGHTTYLITLKDVDTPGLPEPVGPKKTVSAESSAVGFTSDSEFSSYFTNSDIANLTNSTVSTTSGDAANETAELASEDVDSEEEDAPAVDPTLDEAGHILIEYIELLEKSKVMTAGKQDS